MKTPPPRHGAGARGATARERIDTIAVEALTYLASEPEHLARFFEMTGLAPKDLRKTVGTRGFNVNLLEFLCADAALLYDFAARNGHDPAAIDAARIALADHPPED